MTPNSLKAVSQTETELRVSNYIVLFGGRDLSGEYFTQRTNFRSNYTDLDLLYVDFEHGRDPDRLGNDEDNVLGVVDWRTARTDDRGIFVERVLNRRAEYVRYLEELIGAGVLGTSSAAVPGASKRTSSGEILAWPLMRDSLTVTPMEPRMLSENSLLAVKALANVFPGSKSLAALLQVKTLADCTRVRELEHLLCDRLGLSNRKAKAAAAALWPILNDRDGRNDDRDDHEAENERIRALAAEIQTFNSYLKDSQS